MGRRTYVLESTQKEIVQMDLNQSLIRPYSLAFGLSVMSSFAFLIPMSLNKSLNNWLLIAMWWVPIFSTLFFFPAQGIVSEVLYGTKHRLLCGSFHKLLEKGCSPNSFFMVRFYVGLKWLCRNLGKYVTKEEVDEFCCAGKAYLVRIGMVTEHGNGRWLRGAALELNSFVDNPSFYGNGHERRYATLRRHSRKWAEDGEKLFKTREQADFDF